MGIILSVSDVRSSSGLFDFVSVAGEAQPDTPVNNAVALTLSAEVRMKSLRLMDI